MSEKNEWKPIESAPKDGQSILGWGPCQDAVVIAWDEWAQPEPGWKAVGLEVNGYGCPAIVLRGEPTLWQPVPATPCPSCNDQGAVGNILTAEPCPDCSPAPSAPGDAQDEHQAFEADYEAHFGYPPIWDEELLNGKGAYINSSQRNAFSMWQHGCARASAPAAGDALALEDLQRLIEYAQTSDDCQYGTLSTGLVRDLTAKAIAALAAQVPHKDKGDA